MIELLVVGGGPAALAAAGAYREAGGRGEVLIVSEDDRPPYFRPPLSKDYLRGTADEGSLPLQPPSWYAERDVGIRYGIAVTDLDADRRRVRLADRTALEYRHCVLATGAEPMSLPVPGADHPAVGRLRSLRTARELRSAAEGAASAIVVGSGFIGCEAAASLARRGLRVTVVSAEPLPQQQRLGEQVGRRIAGWLAEDGVTLIGDASVEAVLDGRRVRVAGHGTLEADLVLLATGMRPRVELAERAGVTVHGGRVVTDERMRTGAAGLYAAGDVALAHHPVAGRALAVEHWGEALAMGEVAGATAAGADAAWDGVPGFWSEVGERALKYAAWGDGYTAADLVEHGDGGFTVWYSTDGVVVGVATHQADEDYEHGSELVRLGKPVPGPGRGLTAGAEG